MIQRTVVSWLEEQRNLLILVFIIIIIIIIEPYVRSDS